MKNTRLYPSVAPAVDFTADISPSPAYQRESFLHTFRHDVIAGLRAHPKSLPCKYLYDARGSRLFDEICRLPEYYPTRTELGILKDCLQEVSNLAGPHVQLIEYGSGSGMKTRMLLHSLDQPTGCVMLEISADYLSRCANDFSKEFPAIALTPVCADYTQPLRLPTSPPGTTRRLAFFPGSTIGNFNPEEAVSFLTMVAQIVGEGGALLIGVDLQKNESVLHAAYNDAAGVTAEFNQNILHRINRELDGELPIYEFEHYAPYNHRAARIEMHLVARRNLRAKVADEVFSFTRGESIHTESSYKYTIQGFTKLAATAGWNVNRTWTDDRELFSVLFLTAQ